MLQRLSVYNLAVVENIEAEFGEGLNVLTGETGAGKSVIIGALELVLGSRADASIVRDGAKEARVEAVFTDGAATRAGGWKKLCAILEELGIEQGEELVIRRTIGSNGGSRVWVNDQSSTVATLKKLGVILADIHGPRANQNILEEKFQRGSLDSFGAIDVSKYLGAWEALAACREEAEALRTEKDTEGEEDLLRFQVGELEAAAITSEDDEIEERHLAASHSGDVIECANAVTEALGGDNGVSALLSDVHAQLARVSRFFPDAEGWMESANALALGADELSRSVADCVSRLDADAAELERLDERLSVVNRIKRKYHLEGASPISSAVEELLEKKRRRLEALEGREERLAELEREEAKLEEAARREGKTLRTARAKAGEKLAKGVTQALRGLGFAQAKFSVRVDEAPCSRSGADNVAFIFEPNPGESARPLADIASSGEAARVMLAIKSMLSSHDGTGTLVFDEIDANIGGETGKAVGERMRETAKAHQVIAITHLAQSAVYSERHLVVAKHVVGGRTRTSIRAVEGEEREREIARMLGGGKAALDHARAMIADAAK